MKKSKRTLSILGSIILYIFLAITIFAVIMTLVGKNNDGAVNIFGHQMRIVLSDSMGKCDETDVSSYDIGAIPIRSLIFIETVPEDDAERDAWYDELEAGDVITFRYVYTRQITITHRIIDKQPNSNGGYILTLEGDNKSAEDNLLTQTINTSDVDTPNYCIGKVVGQFYPLGLIISFLREPIGLGLLVIVPCVIIIILEVIKIMKVLGADKKKKEDEERSAKEAELADLRRKLEELERLNAKVNSDNAVGESVNATAPETASEENMENKEAKEEKENNVQ